MGLSHEHVGPKILAKIQIYILTRAELLFTLCSEIPCIRMLVHLRIQPIVRSVSTNSFKTLLEFQGLLENPEVMSHLKKVHSKLEREKK